MEQFENKAVIVTGAGVGIGYALCRAFARAGAMVALNDMDGDLARQAAARINSEVGQARVRAFGGDVADAAQVRQMVAAFAGQVGRLDIAIANAGITNYGPFLEFEPEAFDRLMAVNLRGSYFTAQAAARLMIDKGIENGRILLMSSVTGIQAFPSLSAYSISKAGIRHMVRVLALELGGDGITVNAISPGATLTERTVADDPDYEANWAGVTPTGRVAYVEDVVAAALFLASPAARQITGQTLQVDGGWPIYSPVPEGQPH